MRRWEDAYLDGLVGLVLAAALGLYLCSLASCGHYERHRLATTRSAESTEYKAAASSSSSSTSSADRQAVAKRTRRVVTRRPDGTIIDDQLAEELLDVSRAVVVANAGAKVDVAGAGKRAEDKHDQVDAKAKAGPPWWLWIVVAAVLTGVVGWAIRRWRRGS